MRFSAQLVVLLLAIVAGGTWVVAQAVQPKPVFPNVISGNDIGFRVESHKGARPVGRIVIRVNGQWVEPEYATGVKFLTE